MLLPIFLMLACSGEDETEKENTETDTTDTSSDSTTATDTGTDTGTETDSTTDTSTGTTTETGTETETETETEAQTDFVLQVSGADGMKAGLVQIYLVEDGPPPLGDSITVSGVLSAEDQAVEIAIGTPDASSLGDFEDGVAGALWVPFLFNDANENDAFDESKDSSRAR